MPSQIILLGSPSIIVDGQLSELTKSNKGIALLSYLIVHGRSETREHLADLLWDSNDTSASLRNLRVLLSRVRPHLPNLDAGRNSVQYLPKPDETVDYRILSEKLSKGNTLISLDDLRLYRGELLENFYLEDAPRFMEWLTVEQEKFRLRVLDVHRNLCKKLADEKRWREGGETAAHWLSIDEMDEEAIRYQLQFMAAAGQVAAALKAYSAFKKNLWDRLNLEPEEITQTLAGELETLSSETADFFLTGPGSPDALNSSDIPEPDSLSVHQLQSLLQRDWQEAPHIHNFYGREKELSLLDQWLVNDRCRLVAILGMGGQGKTTLAAKVVERLVQPAPPTGETGGQAGVESFPFDIIIWRSLLNAPPFASWLGTIIQRLTGSPETRVPASLDEQLLLILENLRRRRCLLILDNAESIMQEEQAGEMRPDYEAYSRLLRWVGEKEHQSCLLLTSREKPKTVARLARAAPLVQTLDLAGLSAEDGAEILRGQGLVEQPEAATALVQRYSGNPLALNLIAETVDELFDGDIDLFLQEDALIFDDIRTVLDHQFARLSGLEQDILLWLAVSREPISIETLRNNLTGSMDGGAFLQGIRALQRRSLLEKDERGLTLQNVITEYLTERLIEQVSQEIETGELKFLNSHALLLANAKTYVRYSQERLILQPLAERLTARLGLNVIDQNFRQLLDGLRRNASLASGYAAGNIFNLLLHLRLDVTGYNFSHLSIRQAFLQGALLPMVNFNGADLSQAVFTDTFGTVQTLAFSPDGQLLAVGTKEGEIRLWRVRDSQWQVIISGQTASIWSIAFSPDGQSLASGSTDHQVRLWHVQSGQLRHTLHGHTSEVWSVAFSSDGQTLASASNSDPIHLWAVHTGQLLATLETEEAGSSRAVAFSPNGRTLASSDRAHNIHVWDVQTQQVLLTLSGHTDHIIRIAFSPDGRILASAGQDTTVRLWDVTDLAQANGHARHILHGHADYIVSLAFSPDGQVLASGCTDSTVRLWDAQTGKLLHILHHGTWIWSIAFTPDGKTVVSGGAGQTLRLWDVRTGQLRYDLRGHTSVPRSVAFSPDGQILASGGQDKFVRLWDVSTLLNTDLSPVHKAGLSNMAKSKVDYQTLQSNHVEALIVTFSPDGSTLAIGNNDGSVHLWDVPRQRLRIILKGHEGEVFAGAFSPDGQLLASGSQDATVHLWDVHTGQIRLTLAGHTSRVYSLAFSPSGSTLASASGDGTVRLWDISTLPVPNDVEGLNTGISSMFMTDVRVDNTARDTAVYSDYPENGDTGPGYYVLRGQSFIVFAVAFSPNGRMLTSSGEDHKVRLWNVSALLDTDGTLIRSKAAQAADLEPPCQLLVGHTSWVWSVAFSPDGKLLATASEDRTVHLWDVETGEVRQILKGHTLWVYCVAFSPDGNFLASSSGDETIRLWEVETGTCLKVLRAPGPYNGMNISGVTGLTEAQKLALKALGAVE